MESIPARNPRPATGSRRERVRSVGSMWLLFLAVLTACLYLVLDLIVTMIYGKTISVGSLNNLLVTRGSLDAAQLVVHSIVDPWLFGLFVAALSSIAALYLNRARSLFRASRKQIVKKPSLAVLASLILVSLLANLLSPTLARSLEPIEVYLGSKSVQLGDTVKVFLNSPNQSAKLELVKFGQSEFDDAVTFVGEVPRITQTTGPLAYEAGAAWGSTAAIATSGLTPGVYAVRVTGQERGGVSESVFCLRPNAGSSSDVALLLNTNTWAAYNPWGGASIYTWDLPYETERLKSRFVSVDRPNPREHDKTENNHLFSGELHFIRWLEASGVDYECLTDSDFHSSKRFPEDFKVLILSTHPEYWTTEMFDNLEFFLSRGGSLLNLGGNVVYWKTSITDNGIFVDAEGKLDGEGKWRDVGRPESEVLGVRYDSRGYATYAPYEVLLEDHWLFEGTGLKNGATFGEQSLISGAQSSGGASGNETDKSDEFSPSNGLILARGTNPDGGGGELFFYEHPGGGSVLSFGSLTSASAVPVDPAMARLVTNFLRPLGVRATISSF